MKLSPRTMVLGWGFAAWCLVGIMLLSGSPHVSATDDPYADDAQPMERQEQFLSPTSKFPVGGYQLKLRVVSAATREPLEKISVGVSYPEARWNQEDFFREYTTASGEISVDGLPQGRWRLHVSSPIHQSLDRFIAIPDEQELVVALEPLKEIPWTAYVRGRVVDEVLKTPISGVEVHVGAEVPPGTLYHHSSSTMTDNEGRFLAGPLPGAGYKTGIYIHHENYFDMPTGTVYLPAVSGDWKEDVGDLYLVQESGIRGQLQDAGGTPLSRHLVYIIPADIPYKDREAVIKAFRGMKDPHGYVQRHHTDESGKFQSLPLRAGKYTVVFGDLDRDIKELDVPYGRMVEIQLQKGG